MPARQPSVLVLFSQVDMVTRGEDIDILAEQETAHVAQEVARGLQELGYRVATAPVTDDVCRALAPYAPEEWLVFNLCESPDGNPALEATVPPILEARGYLYTGSPGDTLAVCLNKGLAKEKLLAHGLPTPAFAVLSSPDQPCAVPFPALVKPLAEDGSIGITAESVVRDRPSLARRVAYVLERYQEPALVEEFIGGREFNQGIWGNDPPQPLPPAEIDFRGFADPLQRLVTYEAKWVEGSYAYDHTPVTCPAEVDPALTERLQQVAVRAFQVMGCRDYARVDMRERDGQPYILEVNPNPTLASDAGFFRAARVAGYSHARMVEQIVLFALARRGTAT